MSKPAKRLTDRAAVEQVAVDYMESWLTGDGERMAASLHPELAKRAIDDTAKGLGLSTITAAEMAEATAAGEGTRLQPGHQVQVFDIDGDLASLKLTSTAYVEYLHLARFGERWLIVNVLWRNRIARVQAG